MRQLSFTISFDVQDPHCGFFLPPSLAIACMCTYHAGIPADNQHSRPSKPDQVDAGQCMLMMVERRGEGGSEPVYFCIVCFL